MIHIVLDTNIYRNNPRRDNLNFKALEKLAKSGIVKLHIPYIVEREFQTQQREIYSKSLIKAQSAFSGLSKKQLSTDILTKLNSLKNELNDKTEEILSEVENEFVTWADDMNANRYPLCREQALNALEAYFKGNPPLKTPKIREDIPDSFLVQAIINLQAEKEIMHVIGGDRKVKEAFSSREGFFTYEDLSDFVELEMIQEELKELDLLNNLQPIKNAIQQYEEEKGQVAYKISQDIGEAIIWKTISSTSIPDDNNEATIDGYYEAEDIELHYKELSYYGNGQFGIPFSLRIIVTATYYIYKSDYYCMDASEEYVPSVSEHNDHYFEAEDEFEVTVEGMVSITIDKGNINLENFEECVEDGSIGINEIESIELCL